MVPVPGWSPTPAKEEFRMNPCTEIRWAAAEIYSIHADGLRALATEQAEAGDLERAHELERLAAACQAALEAER